MAQLVLQSPGILAHQLDRTLERLLFQESLELVRALHGLLPDHPGYAAALEVLEHLVERLGPRFPNRTQRIEAIAEVWKDARRIIAAEGLTLQTHPFDRLAHAFHRRFGELMERAEPGMVLRDTPAGWYLLQADLWEAATRSLEATVQAYPLSGSFRFMLAQAHTRLAPGSPTARAAYLAALLVDPASMLLEDVFDPDVRALAERVGELELAGQPQVWMAQVGLCEGVFDWDQLPGPPIWDGSGVPAGLSGQAGASMAFLGVLQQHRLDTGRATWQVAEARRQLKQLAPRLYASCFERQG